MVLNHKHLREISDEGLGAIICSVSCASPCTCPFDWIQILYNSICHTGSSFSSNWQRQIARSGVTLCGCWLVYPDDVSVPTIPLGTRAWDTKVYVVDSDEAREQSRLYFTIVLTELLTGQLSISLFGLLGSLHESIGRNQNNRVSLFFMSARCFN